ncbi:sensor domain-containing diguanylate cyclase [Dechloromonas sp. H13]|uniref:sensor domain-containing diguanylate cyclase n=1 Tax=Dechloromonas sp. H13 TaxID=2570193 RepID=UPI0012920697|nr:sensor domain-containing diguanylate cyclase [Dechloromonas sp. H13]
MRSRLARYLLTLVIPSGLLCALFLWSLYHEEQVRVRQNLEVAEQLRLAVGARSLTSDLDRIASDVRLMASLPSLAAAFDSGDAPAVARLTEDFVALSASRRVYDQLRWIDETGIERVRVDFIQNRPFVVPEERLQNKSLRYFFKEAMQLEPGQIFVSPLDLNVEEERVETPFKPVIRLATPVRDRTGQPRGIVIANFFGSYLLDKFVDVTEAKEGAARVNLLNRDGYWLRAPQSVDEWGFMFNRKEHFGTRYPQAWAQIAGSERGQFEDDDGLWSFVTVRPLLIGVPRDPQVQLAGSDEYVWKVVSRIPPEVLQQAANQNLGGWIIITLLFIGALLAGSLVLARAQRRRDVMAENLRALNRRLEEKVRQRTEQLHQQAIRDPLTGLFNRRYLDETLPREIHRALREREPLSVAMLDLDHFKHFNDQWGHEAGDAVLLGVAEALLDGLRASDIACRYGGEELLVVMPGADADEAEKRIATIACGVRNLGAKVMGRELPPVTFSAGVATLPEHGDNPETLVRAADRALYMAKETGRDRVVIARPPGQE